MTASHTLDGEAVDWLHAGERLSVRFGLNLDDADARVRNQGAQVRMFANASLPQVAPDRLFPNVVAATRRAALSVQIRARSKSALGFGFRLRTEAEPVVERLYAVGRPDADGFRSVTVRRFQHEASLIVVDLMRARLGRTHNLAALQQLWVCDIVAWDVHQFLDPVTARVYTEDNPRFPRTRREAPSDVLRGTLRAAGGDAPRVNAGVIWADDDAEQTFERVQVQREDDPDEKPIGSLRVHFFVVDSD
ncbi:hypothetical protein J5226_00265 [Lysobacter sp. K5869]|uniref:hypothetical protein n=1 Tax=Lysobacter sp. K5869 TaxID=2820808 RepID=UPI001C061D28|nr:hypothetical protein [Lysobacter sp. K5869]QWP76885.1 hypothetical protein J5226_00265 [Lysobacter sp. K5869]